MGVSIFKDLTTEDHIIALEVEASSYKGLYVDMDKAPERKYVKDKAKTITDLVKSIERARIDKASQFKVDINKEAGVLTKRLEDANKPFTALIEEYATERAKVLAEEKAKKKAIEDAVKFENDHEFALLMNSKLDNNIKDQLAKEAEETARLESERIDREKKIAEQAAEDAKVETELKARAELDRVEREKQDAIQREIDAKEVAERATQQRIQSEQNAKLKMEKAERRRIAAEKQAKQDAIDAAERAKHEQIALQQAEDQRIEDEAARRAADVEHSRTVNRGIVAEFQAAGLSYDDSVKAVKVMAKGIANVTINY